MMGIQDMKITLLSKGYGETKFNKQTKKTY